MAVSSCSALRAKHRRRNPRPEAAFYVMFGVDGMADSLAFAKRLVHEARVGLAPGSAFGASGRGLLRLCFARNAEQLETAMQRLVGGLAGRAKAE